jgi:hypothetical protein
MWTRPDAFQKQRRLAAIVSADVAGYSRLMGRDESGTLAALEALRQEVVAPSIASDGGRIVKTAGDGLLVEFPIVVNAVRCAVEVQIATADRATDMADDRRIAFRIGINIGDIIVDDDDIFGDGVNIAARLQRLRHPGVCISSRVHDDVRDRLDIAFDDGRTSHGQFRSCTWQPESLLSTPRAFPFGRSRPSHSSQIDSALECASGYPRSRSRHFALQDWQDHRRGLEGMIFSTRSPGSAPPEYLLGLAPLSPPQRRALVRSN